MDEQKKEWAGVWIPKSVWLNEELGWTEKMLLVEIKSLDNKDGCFASNEHFAKFFKLSKDRISKLITNLNRMDYLTVKLIYKEGTKQVEKRIIRVNILKYEGKGENTDRYGQKILEGMGENADRGIGENAVDNNTSINNTINIKDNAQIELDTDFDEFYSYYPKKVNKKKAKSSYIKARVENKKEKKPAYTKEHILNGLFGYLKYLKINDTELKFTKGPDVFLNGEHFNDEYDFTPAMNNGKKMSALEAMAYGNTTSSEITSYGTNSVPKQIGF